MYTLLVIFYIIVCLFLIMVVLLQQGKGADVAAAFGGSSTQASFGPRGSTTLMHKLTTGSFVVFVMICIGISVMTARRGRSVTAGVKSAAPAATSTPVPGAATTGTPAPSEGTATSPTPGGESAPQSK